MVVTMTTIVAALRLVLHMQPIVPIVTAVLTININVIIVITN